MNMSECLPNDMSKYNSDKVSCQGICWKTCQDMYVSEQMSEK